MPEPSGHLIVENSVGEGDPRHFKDQDLTGRILLDGGHFEGCRFQEATLVYMGGVPPALVGCQFQTVQFQFLGAAARTVGFLQAMASRSSGLSPIFKATFPRLFAH